MWFINKKTGLKWDINDKEMIYRLSKDEDFEEVKEEKKAASNKKK